jgi:hypothetical protein
MTYDKVISCDIKYKNNKSIVEPEEYESTLKKYECRCELVGGLNQQVRPYYDADPVDDDSFDFDADILDKNLSIQTLFEDTFHINDIHVAKRQYEKDGIMKYSSHYTVDKIECLIIILNYYWRIIIVLISI